ncbi:unnamed protein product [Hermetia illucens]|uniref:DUF5641 domain-containing protein n=1 Tax=Hermetia illucens TaxID=343691 RepID=A0A7R8Z1D0_HERIL|nr:unnamed protein product [Hermetia illucens]
MVLVKERDMPPSKWPLARIQEVYPRSDEPVRGGAVRYHGNILKQTAVTNLSQLPVDIPPESNATAKAEVISHILRIVEKQLFMKTSKFQGVARHKTESGSTYEESIQKKK